MAAFDDLQSLWQSQEAPPAAVGDRDAASLAKAFQRYGRRQDLINFGKVLLLVAQLFWVVGRVRHSPLQMFGLTLADCSIVYFLMYEWRNQRVIARLNFAASSRDFVRSAIERLMAQRHPFHGREFYILMGGFWVGCTAMLADGALPTHLTKFLLNEAWITVLTFVLGPLGNYLRAKRWNHDARPLVDRLNALLQATQERAE